MSWNKQNEIVPQMLDLNLFVYSYRYQKSMGFDLCILKLISALFRRLSIQSHL